VQHMRDVLNHNVASSSNSLPPISTVVQTLPVQVASATNPTLPTDVSNLSSWRAARTTGKATPTVSFDASIFRASPTPQSRTQKWYATVNIAPEQACSRPMAIKVRAIESTALGTEQIDSLFQM